MSIWIAQTIIKLYRIKSNAKSIKENFYKYEMLLYTKYDIKINNIFVNVILSSSHVQKILEIDLVNFKK